MASWKQIIVNASNSVVSSNITDGAITSAKLANEAVTGSKIEAQAVDSTHIAQECINDSAMMASNVVSSAKIASSAVTSTKIGSSAVTEAKIASNAVTSAKIANNTITTSDMNIGNTAVSGYPLTFGPSGGGMFWNQLSSGGIATNAKIDNDAISASKIQDETITSDKLADGVIPTKNYQHFCHNFYDDIGTSTHYIPWNTGNETTTTLSSNSSFLALDSMDLKAITIKPMQFNPYGWTLTVRAYRANNNSTSFSLVDSITMAWNAGENYHANSSTSLDCTLSAGQTVAIYIDSNVDPGGTIHWLASTVWEVDISGL